MSLRVTWNGKAEFDRFEEAVRILGSDGLREAESRAINRTGDMARTQVRRTLPKQAGLKRGTIVRAIHTRPSSAATLTYTMEAGGGDVRLKYFGARETRPGVTAAPFGKRRLIAGAFMRAGWWPNRVVKPKWNGQVFSRNGDTTSTGKDAFHVEKSGVFIPKEMVKGATADAFNAAVARVLPQRIAHEIKRATKGVVS